MKPLTTSIIAGIHKNKRLRLPDLKTTRSSKSILKESFFNVLQYDIIDKVFVECFAGSGSIGLEALSRGASKCYFIEQDKSSFDILRKNCAIDTEKTICIYGDSFVKTPQVLQQINTDKSIVLYIDPPFDDVVYGIYKKTFDMVENITNSDIYLVAFESQSDYDMPQTIGRYKHKKTKKFGKSSLVYYESI